MSPQFQPSDRETVKEALKENAKGGDVGDTGDGLCVVMQEQFPVHTFGALVRKTGWAPTALYQNDDADEILIQFTPLREVGDE